ncbi:hypothetical protein ACKWTF_003771 [Chironomus riparius]
MYQKNLTNLIHSNLNINHKTVLVLFVTAMAENQTCDLAEIIVNINWKSKTIIFVVLELINAIFAVVGNILVFIVFFREQKLRRKINFYIISLAIADFGVGLIGIPFGIFVIITKIPNEVCPDILCLAPISFLLTFSNVSIFSLVLISIKRFTSLIVNPTRQKLESTKNIAREISICWMFGILIGFLPIFWNNKSSTENCILTDVLSENYIIFRFTIVVLIPSLVIGVVYIKIYKIIKIQSRKQAERQQNRVACEKFDQKLLKKEIRATISISLIILMFWITWIPLQISYLVSVFCEDCIKPSTVAFFIGVIHFNSAINPLLYAYRMKDIRIAIVRLFNRNYLTSLSSTG